MRQMLLLIAVMVTASGAMAGPSFNHPPRVVDSQGRTVGTLIDSTGFVLRREGAVAVGFQVTGSSIQPLDTKLLHTTDDCSGPVYVRSESTPFRPAVMMTDTNGAPTTAYYRVDATQKLVVRSCLLS